MQIHEITINKKIELDEGWADPVSSGIGQAAGSVVSGIKNVGSAIASPFKDVAGGYKAARQDQKVSAMADKAFRAWQGYVGQLEQSIAAQPATAAAPAAGKQAQQAPQANTMANAPVSATNKASPTNPNLAKTPNYDEVTGAPTPAGQAKQAADDARHAELMKTNPKYAATMTKYGAEPSATTTAAPATTAPAKPNYGAQTGAGAKVTYNQPTGVPNPLAKTPQPTSRNMVQPPATVASTAQGQPITVGGQKLKPGTPEYDQIAKATLKELQAPGAATSPALAAFKDRSDGKYEQYLRAFVQKNLLAGMGFKGLVNQSEIDNIIKAIAAPANADPSKQRPLWNDLVRACALAMPAQGALTGRDPKAPKDTNAPDTTKPGQEAPGEETAGSETSPTDATVAPAKPTMTKDQISQWISRNSEDNATLKAALAAINSAKA